MLLLALLQAPPAHMAPPPPPPRPFPVLALGRELNLTPEQHQAIHGLLERHRESLHAKHEAAAQAREAFRKGMDDPRLSVAELDALQQVEAAAHRAEYQEAHALLQEAMGLLTQEQARAYDRLRVQLAPARPSGPPRPEGPPLREGAQAPWIPRPN